VIPFRPELPIRTERLVLRPYRDDDYDAFADIQSREDVHLWLYTSARSPEEVRDALDERTRRDAIETEGAGLTLAIELRERAAVVGDVSFWITSTKHAQGEIGFIVHPDHQRRGYASEAAAAVLRLGFEHAGMHRIVGRCEVRNEGSAAALRKLGMRLEAHFVENEWVKEEWQSEYLFAILHSEWGLRQLAEPGSRA
jgi:RimJ/RimL family protein N-acetyltransferase